MAGEKKWRKKKCGPEVLPPPGPLLCCASLGFAWLRFAMLHFAWPSRALLRSASP